ncbi:MAG TPA: PAS domain-containing protein [Stellaceae bacterium]
MLDLIDQIETPNLRRLYAYWDGLRRGREFPARRDVDPLDFPYALGHIALLDVLYGPLRFRFRLHGTALVLRAGYDMTGKMADELPNLANRTKLLERCRRVIETRRPVATIGERAVGRHTCGFEVLWLPLSDDGNSISMLLGGLFYRDEPAATHLDVSRNSAA